MREHCKFLWRDKTRYGLVDEYHPQAKIDAKKGLLIVNCLIGSDICSVPMANVTDVPRSQAVGYDASYNNEAGIWWGGGEFDDFVELCHLAAMIRESRLTGDKLQPGHQFSIGVADGSANYVVTKVMRKNCDVEWRGWCPDRWHDHHYGSGGRFPIADVIRYVRPGSTPRFAGGMDDSSSGRSKITKQLIEHFKTFSADFEKRHVPLLKSEFLEV